MANSRIGQYRLEFDVTGFVTPIRSHKVGLWVAPTTAPASGTPPSAIDCQLLGGGTKTLQEVANQFLDFIRPFWASTVSIGAFNLWRYVTENSRDFVTAGTATTSVVGAGSVIGAQQATFTFRHANGGIGKVVLLETNGPGDSKVSLVPNATGSAEQKLAAYLLSVDSPMIALDNSFPVAPLFIAKGQNESIWRKLYRQ